MTVKQERDFLLEMVQLMGSMVSSASKPIDRETLEAIAKTLPVPTRVA